MFPNGTAYMMFLDHECGSCPHYVDFYDDPKNVCSIEDRISRAQFNEKYFPYEWLDEFSPGQYACRKKKGLAKKE